MQTIDLEPFQYGEANITGIRFVSPENNKVAELASLLNLDETNSDHGNGKLSR